MFWLIAVLLVLVVVSFTAAPLMHTKQAVQQSTEVALYKAQLTEIDSDHERGLIDAAEAERAKAEVARRLIAADKSGPVTPTGIAPSGLMAMAGIGIVALGVSFATYRLIGTPSQPDQPLAERLAFAAELRENRPSQQEFEALAPELPPVAADEDYLAQVAQLREIVPTRPDDLRGWQLLARHEANLQNFAAAARAQGQVLRLTDPVATEDLEAYLELLGAAAGGLVSPEAEAVARELLTRDEMNPVGRYYLGAMHYDTGRPDIAFRVWRPLAEVQPQTYHTNLARLRLEDAAWFAGTDYTLPELRGPSASDIAAAEDMAPEDRQAMIAGMVATLSNRLANEGGPASDWARLISSYGILGETEAAAAIWAEARVAFAADAEAMAVLQTAAEQAGVAE